MPEVRLSVQAQRDLRRLGRGPGRETALAGVATLGQGAANADVKAVVGARGWRRLRSGDYRLLFWRRPDGALVVQRIVNRRDLTAAIATLPDSPTD